MTHRSPALPDVTSLLLSTESVEQFLQGLAESALVLAPAAVGAGITLEREHRPLTVVSTGPLASDLDEAQYGQDDGPCLQALRTGEEILVADMLDERRWGPYPAYAMACGTRSSLSLPIAAHTHTAGALNLYAPKASDFSDADLSALRALAAQATGVIAIAQRIADAQQFAKDLQAAMESRTLIDQAIGVIMGRRRCTADEAFGLLRTASQHRNVKLRDLCRELVTSVGGGPPSDGGALRPRP
ncbi:GAF and ANTAR domain-containing protein [Streptomyces sp. TG1A-8]|uniref:GAF and ANTAR domain-containing protein n=1 Tax=Streptomyces sp. TG1A-8 TaxID=3051385 RepID=UPI00265C1FC1|nr:GAF and ANTAR domain-containing protein [Streptomyces sp. TG1A-8]MDO0925291.1 GAF and ANTAR domain-containing protein [Streptomyces sp. TG1A-8]